MQTSRQSAIEVLAGTLIGFLVANGSGQIGTALTHLPEQNLLYKLAVDRHRTDRETFVSVKAMQDEWAEVIGD